MDKVKITLVKSIVDRPKDQKDTVKALGLTKMNQTAVHNNTDQIKGMVHKVGHLLKVEAA